MEGEFKLGDVPTTKKERNFPQLELNDPSSTLTTNNVQQPVLVIQSPKTPTLSRKLKAVSLDSDPPKQTNTLEVSRDVFSMPNTPKKQLKPKLSCEFDDNAQKFMLTPNLSSNLKRFGSNTSISGSQTLKTLPEIMTLQDFSDNRTEPVRIKAKGLLERRGSNASLTIDLGSNSSINEAKPVLAARLNTAKSVSNLNLTTFGSDKCSCTSKKCEGQPIANAGNTEKKFLTDRRKSQTHLETCGNCTIYEFVPSKSNTCKAKCENLYRRCNCVCNLKCRRKSLSNENLYVPPCNFCQNGGSKECMLGSKTCKGYRRACYPRQADLEASQLLSEDFKLHLQNVQYLQTAGSVLSVSDLKQICEDQRVPKLHQEFWEVPLNLQEKCLVSGSQSRNRYRGVLPNEHSRVHLSGAQPYIHANYIKGPDYTETAYIATQGPMAHTCEDFWEMVWTNKTTCLVMLTGLVEKGRNKCELYFPLGRKANKDNPQEKSFFYVKTTRVQDKFTFDAKNTKQYEEEILEFEELNDVQYGDYKIKYISEKQLGECSIRELELTKILENSVRKITHYWFPNWQDHKMANPEQVLKIALDVLEFLQEQRKKMEEERNKSEERHKNDGRKTNEQIETEDNKQNVSQRNNALVKKLPAEIRHHGHAHSQISISKSCNLSIERRRSLESRSSAIRQNIQKFETVLQQQHKNSDCEKIVNSQKFIDFQKMLKVTDCEKVVDCQKVDSHKVVDCKKIDFDKVDSHKVDSHKFDPHKIDSHKFDLHKIDIHKVDSHKFDPIKIDSHKFDPHKIDSHKFDPNKIDSHKVDSHKFDPHKVDSHRVDSHKFYSHKIDSHKFHAHKVDSYKSTESHKIIDYKKLVEFRKLPDLRKKSLDGNSNLNKQDLKIPIIVHCSAGIGRTGCFLAILNGIQQLRTNFNVDVLAILCSLRLNRGGMVQTAEQYELIHRVLSLYTDLKN